MKEPANCRKEILQQKEEILTQSEELSEANEALIEQKDEIERKKQEIQIAYKDIKLLSEFGQKLTASLDIKSISEMIFNYMKTLMDTDVFGTGIFEESRELISFASFIEDGKQLPFFSSSLSDKTSLAAWNLRNQKEIYCKDFSKEYSNYVDELKIQSS